MASAFIPAVEAIAVELLEDETITSGGSTAVVPGTPSNVTDRDHTTKSVLPASFSPGTHDWWWAWDAGAAVTVTRARVWDPVGSDYWNDPSGNTWIESSDNGSTWTNRPYSYATASVATGYPASPTTTEYQYTLTGGPHTHRYWRVRQQAGGGLNSGRGTSEWFLDGSITAGSEIVWGDAPDTIDADDGSSDDVTAEAITETTGPFWRYAGDAAQVIGQVVAILGFENAAGADVILQGATESDFSDATDLVTLNVDATGSLSADELSRSWDNEDAYQYYQLVLDTTAQDVRVYEVTFGAAPEPPDPVEPAKAILEIYVHDEDASRWGTATWATGPATGDEGIWSAAGWQDITPEGVNAHIIWGSRAPERGILSEQNAGSWNVETYDPDRILDPGNFDSPYYPQLVAGVPIRISHDSLVIRTGYIDRIAYKYKDPNFRGQLLCTDTWALLNQAMVPADSILGNTLLGRISDAINAAGVAVGGIPIPPSGPTGPTIADWVEGAALDDPTSVKAHIDKAAQEALWVVYVQADAGLGLRPWGEPLDRGREITAENLEDLESSSSEEGLYSVARVQVEDPDLDPIEREAAPLPRYGRRMIERTEPTVDPEGWAAAVLQDRSWPGVGYVPGTIHCFTAADVDYFGSLEIMERVTITVPGAVSVQGRILGGELWVEHRKNDAKGANWQFQFAIATDGSTAIGLTTLVADETGDTLVDDMTETDYLEAD